MNYKEHPKDKTKYMMRLPDNVWQAADCPPNLSKGLIWRQDLCNCGEELIPQDPNDNCGLQGYNPFPTNRHKYMRVIYDLRIIAYLFFSYESSILRIEDEDKRFFKAHLAYCGILKQNYD